MPRATAIRVRIRRERHPYLWYTKDLCCWRSSVSKDPIHTCKWRRIRDMSLECGLVEMMLRRWLVGAVAIAVLGSAVFDDGRPSVQTAFARPSQTAGYCENDSEMAATARDSSAAGQGETATQAVNPTLTESQADAAATHCPADMVEV